MYFVAIAMEVVYGTVRRIYSKNYETVDIVKFTALFLISKNARLAKITFNKT